MNHFFEAFLETTSRLNGHFQFAVDSGVVIWSEAEGEALGYVDHRLASSAKENISSMVLFSQCGPKLQIAWLFQCSIVATEAQVRDSEPKCSRSPLLRWWWCSCGRLPAPASALPTLPYSALHCFPAPGTVSGSETHSPKRTTFPQEDPEVVQVCPVSAGNSFCKSCLSDSLSRAQYCALGIWRDSLAAFLGCYFSEHHVES